jgi:hypothetical protein
MRSRLYWDSSVDWINLKKISARTAVGEIQQGEEKGLRMRVPLRAGMKVAQWKPIFYCEPDFIRPMATTKRGK